MICRIDNLSISNFPYSIITHFQKQRGSSVNESLSPNIRKVKLPPPPYLVNSVDSQLDTNSIVAVDSSSSRRISHRPKRTAERKLTSKDRTTGEMGERSTASQGKGRSADSRPPLASKKSVDPIIVLGSDTIDNSSAPQSYITSFDAAENSTLDLSATRKLLKGDIKKRKNEMNIDKQTDQEIRIKLSQSHSPDKIRHKERLSASVPLENRSGNHLQKVTTVDEKRVDIDRQSDELAFSVLPVTGEMEYISASKDPVDSAVADFTNSR